MRTNVTFADLVAIARRVGVKVIEAPSSHRGKLGVMGTVRGLTLHHTGTPNSYRPTVDYPDFNVVKEGRENLWNSLSAFGVGRFEAIYVFSEFLSWHAGTWSWKGITDGNGDFLGFEAAGVGDWTEWQRKVYPRLVASALLFLGEGIDMAPRHMDGAMPRGRKTDAARLDQPIFHDGRTFYQAVQFFMDNPQYININYAAKDWFDMASIDDLKTLLRTEIADRVIGSWPDGSPMMWYQAAAVVAQADPRLNPISQAVHDRPYGDAEAWEKNYPLFWQVITGLQGRAVIDASSIDYSALAKAILDEQDRRARDGDPTTGPAT